MEKITCTLKGRSGNPITLETTEDKVIRFLYDNNGSGMTEHSTRLVMEKMDQFRNNEAVEVKQGIYLKKA